MARLEDLAAQIRDAALRNNILAAIADLKRKQRFGLIFEEHIPETTTVPGLPKQPGSIVQRRDDSASLELFRVTKIVGRGKIGAEPIAGGEEAIMNAKDLLVVKRFGDPIYPALKSVGVLRRGTLDKPHHAVINGENFHALQLFVYLYEGQVDCIYIDPPYNTGARDWKYNNRYVDSNDSWRHSKWLSMMEKRLRLAKRLLKSDGVLICTIDEHEVHHLGMLLEKIFPEYLHYIVTVVINPKGRDKANFAPSNEYALFVVPNLGDDVILRAPGGNGARPPVEEEDIADDEGDSPAEVVDEEADGGEAAETSSAEPEWEWRHARRRGGGAESSSYREKRPNQFYPIYINEKTRRVVKVGPSIPLGQRPSLRKVGGLRPLWPIDSEGRDRVWAFVGSSMQRMIDEGHVALGKYHQDRDDWTLNYRVPKKTTRKLKTVWWERAHDAGTHGTELLKKLLGQPGLFPFPKSVYAVRDTLAAVVRNRPDALILDYFAGSGTTLHATCLLNAEDNGRRRAIIVTNNEVADELATELNKKGVYRGDEAFEKHGIFHSVTHPRCEAAILGKRADGTRIVGNYLNERGEPKGQAIADGFKENVEFFTMEYLDPDEVDLGEQFDAILSSLWLAASGIGNRERGASAKPFSVPSKSPYAVLFREASFRQFREELAKRADIKHVWLVTDSEEAFAEMRSALPQELFVSMLYRDYLRNFRINTRQIA